ncbi:pseudouridine synthase [Montanilutibacter psychrotolerans]|uniref:tRNA pseudouridine synthase C n=1 Tax=Montanilutibacter psychrotolerans TaxID=1327343 RepID=A0A3M8SRF5_9GAMM|nr:pseudouridine synthase [Lysobacter psychrotolerans]RNF83931.1 pseudouridylate synthase [Lysobacter psychrotolerans]
MPETSHPAAFDVGPDNASAAAETDVPAIAEACTEPAPAALAVLYVDPYLAVIDKPAGLMVHDSALARGETDFAADRLREQFGRPIFLVHRLDRATSGCLLLAFDRDTASALGRVLMSREVEKDYWAVCRGWPEEAFVIDHDLDGGPGKPIKKPAITRFERLATTELEIPSAGFGTSRYALLRAQPETGRFRQIRRHLKHVSHHLIGDTSHGDGRHNRNFRMLGIHRMLLHARRLAFVHPHDGTRIEVTAPLDAEFAKALALFADAPAH